MRRLNRRSLIRFVGIAEHDVIVVHVHVIILIIKWLDRKGIAMKKILLLTRNEGSDHIIEALMKYDDIHVVLAVVGTCEERTIAESYSSRIDLIYTCLEGELSNLECVDDLEYEVISQSREIESDFEDGTGRFIDNYAMVKYRYYTSLSYWHAFFSKNEIDCMIIRGLTHGLVHDVIPLYFARKKNIPCYQLEDNYFSVGSLFLPNESKYMEISLGMGLSLERCMHYPLSASPPKRKGVKAHCVHLISKLGGPLLLNLASDIRRGVWKRRTQFGIKYSEYSIMSAILSYWKFLRLYHYLNRLSGSVDYSCKYIVYYLQFEPEATTQVRCTLKSQLIAIKMLSQALPKGWTLYVKEHPHQFLLNKENIGFDYYIPSVNKYKNKIYYDKIASMDHTVLVAPEVPSVQINKYAMAIATFNGTVAIEATKEKKPILLFGAETTWLQYCEDIMKISSFQSCKEMIEKICTGWEPNYDDLITVMNQYAYPRTPEGTSAVIRRIMEKENVCN